MGTSYCNVTPFFCRILSFQNVICTNFVSNGTYLSQNFRRPSEGILQFNALFSRSPKAGHPKACQSDFRNSDSKPIRGKRGKCGKSLSPQKNKGLRRFRRAKTQKMRKMRTWKRGKRGKRGKCGWLALMWLALGDPNFHLSQSWRWSHCRGTNDFALFTTQCCWYGGPGLCLRSNVAKQTSRATALKNTRELIEEDQKGYPEKGYPWKGQISPILGHLIQ